MNINDYIIRGARKIYRFLSPQNFPPPECIKDRQLANQKIAEILSQNQASMLSRFGTTELITINNYLCVTNPEPLVRKLKNYITDHTHTPWWFKDHFHYLNIYSGVFPPTEETSINFSRRYLNDIPLIDILGSFQYYEKFMPLRKDVINLHLETLYPFFVHDPWTSLLKGKKILVIHPFEKTIQQQYQKRELLFDHPEVLPKFELITLKAIQSLADMDVPFNNWFEALQHMENQISKIEFDICLLGCGAYGLPLAAYIKRLGKHAIHLGGGLQLLFGIKGKRWDNSNYGLNYNIQNLFNRPYSSLYNEHWIKPLKEDTPNQAIKVDNACYW